MSLTFRKEARGAAFRELLEVMLPQASRVGLVVETPEREATVAFPAAPDGKLLSREESRAWPGSEIPDWAPPVLLFTFVYDSAVARTLYDFCPEMYGWQQRGLLIRPALVRRAGADGPRLDHFRGRLLG